MYEIVRRLGHLRPARPVLAGAARAIRGRFSLRTTTPLTARAGIVPPFFIVGSGRSGNTLMRAMLHAHPELAIPPESYALPKVAWAGRVYRGDPWPRQVDRILALFDTDEFRRTWQLPLQPLRDRLLAAPPERRGIDSIIDVTYRGYIQRHAEGAERWGDKTPLNALYLPWISDLFPGAQYIHMLRDGRDVALSYVRAGLYTTLEEAAARWVRSVRDVRRFQRTLRPAEFIEIRYEELVAQSAIQLERVSAFLGVTRRPEMLEYWRTGRELGDTDSPHHAGLGRPVTDRSVGRWRTLPPDERQALERVLGDTLGRAGYGR